MKQDGVVKECHGARCKSTLYCWRGVRFADLNQVLSHVNVEIEFSNSDDNHCIDVESDDALTLKSFLFGFENETAVDRLSERIGQSNGWIPSWLMSAVLGYRKTTQHGICTKKSCQAQLSPYGMSCVRICRENVESAKIALQSEFSLNENALYLVLAGAFITKIARNLSERPETFYITGATLGVLFAIALLVLIISRVVTRSGPTNTQLGVAAFFQVGVLYARNAVIDFIKTYVDWIALYVLVTFLSSMGLVHYFLNGANGQIELSSSLKDIVRIALQLLGAFLMAMIVPSPRYRVVTLIGIFIFQLIQAYTNYRGDVLVGTRYDYPSEKTVETPPPYTPLKNLSGRPFLSAEQYESSGRKQTDEAVRKLMFSEENAPAAHFVRWLHDNHSRIKLDLVEKESYVVDDEDSDDGEGEGEEE